MYTLVVIYKHVRSAHADILEPIRAAVILVQPLLAIRQSTRSAARALGRVWALEEGSVLVANISEPGFDVQYAWDRKKVFNKWVDSPVNLLTVLEKTKCNAVDRRVSPSLVKEAAGSVEVGEVLFVLGAAPEVKLCDLEIAPEVAR